MIGLLEDLLCLCSAAQNDTVFLDDVGQQEEQHGGRILLGFFLHQLPQCWNLRAQTCLTYRSDLSHTKVCPCGAEGLVVLIEDLLGGTGGQVASCLKHLLCIGRNVDLCDLCKFLSRCTVHFGTGWRTEHQGIGQNCRAEQSCDALFNLDAVFAVHLVDDGCGAAKRLVTEINRIDTLQSSQTVMVNDFQNICTLYPVHSLILLVVVD